MSPITNPVALADQLDAAHQDADRLFARIAKAGAMHVTVRDASEWFTDRFILLMLDVADGRAVRCEHLAHSPRPAFAALWCPDRVVCTACMSQLHHTTEQPGCDRCGAHPEFFNVHQAQIETLLVFYALCDHCETTEQLETGPDTEVHDG
jgi:hypothetical protein